jgi:hypothetical protein
MEGKMKAVLKFKDGTIRTIHLNKLMPRLHLTKANDDIKCHAWSEERDKAVYWFPFSTITFRLVRASSDPAVYEEE